MSSKMLSIVVPVYQEGALLGKNLSVIHSETQRIGIPFEIVVVDDGSTDNSWEILQQTAGQMAELNALRLTRNFGKEAAICAGLDHARGDACIIIDSDLEHPPELISEMVRLWQDEGWEVVEAVKVDRGSEPLVRKLGAKLFYNLIKILSGHDLHGASDYKLLDRKVVDAWLLMGERNTFFRGMVSWLGYRQKRIEFSVKSRSEGRSRWSLFKLIKLAIGATTSLSAVPLQIVTILGLLVLVGSFAFGVYALWLYFLGLAKPGFTTVILLQLIIGGILMASLGLIGTYIARVYEEVKYRPRYLVTEVITKSHGGIEVDQRLRPDPNR